MNNIYVRNSKRINEILKTNLKEDDDLLTIKDKKVTDFLNKYNKYLDAKTIEDINTLHDLTGIDITHIYTMDD